MEINMKVLSVRPKGIYVELEFSIEQLKMLRDFLSGCKVTYNSDDDPNMADAVSYVSESFYPDLDRFVDDVEKENGLR